MAAGDAHIDGDDIAAAKEGIKVAEVLRAYLVQVRLLLPVVVHHVDAKALRVYPPGCCIAGYHMAQR